MNDNEMIYEIAQTSKKLDDVSAKAFLIFVRALSAGFSTKQAVKLSNTILIRAGRRPCPPELFERPG